MRRPLPAAFDVDRWLLAGAALALAVAVADPVASLPRLRPTLVVTLDITQSMAVPDVLPEADGPAAAAAPAGRPIGRLQAARQALYRVLARLPCGSQVGLAVFTDNRSYLLLAPLEVCQHLAELRTTVAAIDNRMAWTGNSEVAKGLNSAWSVARQLPERPALVFITDGHEAPPLNPRHRPRFDGTPGEVAGLVVGVGGEQAQPIPRLDPNGRPLGHWAADEVLQTDPRSRGRGASVAGEALVDEGVAPAAADAATLALGATPGREHLSGLREGHLQQLAAERGLRYHRLDGSATLQQALLHSALSRQVVVPVSLAPPLLALALLLLAARWRRLWPVGRWPWRRRAATTGPSPLRGR